MVLGLVRHVAFGPIMRASVGPVVAGSAMTGLWLLTRDWFVLSMVASAAGFVIGLGLFGGWPAELPVAWPRRLVLPGLRPAVPGGAP